MAETTGLEIQKLPANPTEGDVQVNAAFDLLDAATQQHLAINFASDADLTLATSGTIAQWQYAVIELTDTGPVLTAARNVIVPNNERVYKLLNSTAQQLTLKTSAGTGVDIPASESTIAFCDGTNVRAISSGGGGSGTTYSVSAETVSGGANLRLTGSDSSTDDVKLAAGNNVTVTRTDANTITIASSGAGAATSSQLETYTYTATAGQTAFSGADDNGNSLLFESFNNILVLLNGVKLVYTDDFTVGTNSITLVSAANVNDVLEVVVVEVAPQGKNLIINGNFDIWQRGTSSTTNNAYIADRWLHGFGDGAGTVSQQAFTIGQTDVPSEPEFYLRHNRTTASTVASIIEQQRIEDVRSLAGQNATISFYAKAGAAKTLNVDLLQSFGTGGAPSSDVITNAGDIALTTSWQKFTFTVAVPSITGKTIGTDGNDYLALRIEEAASFSTFTLDIAQVQLEKGSIATDFEQRPIGEELALCQRYYEKSYPLNVAPGTTYLSAAPRTAHGLKIYTSTTRAMGTQQFKVNKRVGPSVAYYDQVGNVSAFSLGDSQGGAATNNFTADASRSVFADQTSISAHLDGSSAVSPFTAYCNWVVDAEI